MKVAIAGYEIISRQDAKGEDVTHTEARRLREIIFSASLRFRVRTGLLGRLLPDLRGGDGAAAAAKGDPIAPKPSSIVAQVPGSGTAAVTAVALAVTRPVSSPAPCVLTR